MYKHRCSLFSLVILAVIIISSLSAGASPITITSTSSASFGDLQVSFSTPSLTSSLNSVYAPYPGWSQERVVVSNTNTAEKQDTGTILGVGVASATISNASGESQASYNSNARFVWSSGLATLNTDPNINSFAIVNYDSDSVPTPSTLEANSFASFYGNYLFQVNNAGTVYVNVPYSLYSDSSYGSSSECYLSLDSNGASTGSDLGLVIITDGIIYFRDHSTGKYITVLGTSSSGTLTVALDFNGGDVGRLMYRLSSSSDASSVPIPGAALLLGAGLGRLVLYSRRKLYAKS